MANLSQMTTRVATILIDAPAELTNLIPQELDAAQREAEDRYAFWAMRSVVGGLIGTTYYDISLSVPSDFLRIDMMFPPTWNDSGAERPSIQTIEWLPSLEDQIKVFNSADTSESNRGSPKWVLRYADQFFFYPYLDGEGTGLSGAYSVQVPYIGRLAAPSTSPSTDTWFMSDADRYLVFKAASELLTMNRDHEEGQLYALKAEREFKRIMRQDKRSRMKGTTLRMQRDANAAFNQEAQGLP